MLITKDTIDNWSKWYITETFQNKEELKTFFLNHERRPLMVRNLYEEFGQAERKGVPIPDLTLRKMTVDLTKMFCLNALKVREGEIRAKDKAKLSNFDDTFTEKPVMEEPETPEGVFDGVRD